jgi:hypothetical protein
MKKFTYEYVKSYIESRNCQLISDKYDGVGEKLEILFSCGHVDKRIFSKFTSHLPICQKCAGNKLYTFDEIREKVLSFGFILEENQQYKNANTKLDFYDEEGYKYNYSIHCLDNAIKRGFNVTGPFELSNKYALDNIKSWISKNNKPYTLLCDEYKGSHVSNMNFSCNVCGYKWKTAWSCIYSNNSGCPQCAIKANGKKSQERNLTPDYNLKILRPLLAEEWDYEKNNKSPEKVLPYSNLYAFWVCSICGYKWMALVSSRFAGNGCPACKLSSNEQVAYKFLQNNNFKFDIEHEFSDLLSFYGNPLRYDFAIFNADNSIKMLLEIDSKLHDEYIPFFHGSIEEFNIRMQYDEMKDKYAKDHNYNLLRIKEKNFKNIENILIKELNLQRKEEKLIA